MKAILRCGILSGEVDVPDRFPEKLVLSLPSFVKVSSKLKPTTDYRMIMRFQTQLDKNRLLYEFDSLQDKKEGIE